MKFTDINKQDIVTFLNLNNHPITNDHDEYNNYNHAIELINNTNLDIVMIDAIENWLHAFEYREEYLKLPVYVNDLNNYKLLLPDSLKCKSDESIIQILKYLKLYSENIIFHDDILFQIFTHLNEFDNIKMVNKQFNKCYNNLKNNNYFKHQLCLNLLKQNGYKDEKELEKIPLNCNHILDEINKNNGKIIVYGGKQIDYHELFKKIVYINGIVIFITESGRCLFPNNMILNCCRKVDDIVHIWGEYYILSKGKLYWVEFNCINIFSYKARQQDFDNKTTRIKRKGVEVNNILTVTLYDGCMFLLKTNGDLSICGGDNVVIYKNVKYCMSDSNYLYLLTIDNDLYIYGDNIMPYKDMVFIKIDYKIEKLIKSDKVLLLHKDKLYYFDDILKVEEGKVYNDFYKKHQLLLGNILYTNLVYYLYVPQLDIVYMIQK